MVETPPNIVGAPEPSPRSIRAPSEGETVVHNGRIYVLGAEIGEGFFGKVFGCTDRWSNDLVAKMLLPKGSYEEVRSKWLGELNTLLTLRHPNITYAYDAFEYHDTFYLVLERCGADLNGLIRTPNFKGELWLPSLARDVLNALEFIHHAGYVHKDLHPGNVFLSWTRDRMVPTKEMVLSFKIGDLGITRLQKDIDVFNTMLAQWMLPPEALDPNEFGTIGATVDIYHVGLVFLSVLLGQVPTFSRDEILDGKPRKMAEALESPYSQAIAWALRRHAGQRPQSVAILWDKLFEAIPDPLRPA